MLEVITPRCGTEEQPEQQLHATQYPVGVLFGCIGVNFGVVCGGHGRLGFFWVPQSKSTPAKE